MLFEYTRRHGAPSPITDAATFRVGHLSAVETQDARPVDLTYLIDASYDYHSPRELRWHLADRLGVAPAALSLREGA